MKVLPRILEDQTNNIEELKSKIEDIQAHVFAHTVWHRESDMEMSLLLEIRENHETLTIHVAELINYLACDDAKNGEEKKGERVYRSQRSPEVKPTPHGASAKKSKDWLDISKTVVQELYPEFTPLSSEAFLERFKGLDDVKFTKQQLEER